MAEALKDILEEIKSLEPLPQVAMRVLEMSSNDDVIPRELVEVIQTDAGITAKVLKLCNAAYYGFRREIASLPEAGNLLGCSTLVNLVLTSCAGRYFRNYGSGGASAATRWEEAVATAIATSMLASAKTDVDKSRAYTVGLLQNVGHIVLDRFLPEQADRLAAEVASGVSRLDAESSILGIHHAEIGAQLAARWNFPEMLVDTIRHHHTPQDAAVDPTMASVAHLGELFTESLTTDRPMGELQYGLQRWALDRCGLTEADFGPMGARLREELDKARDLVALG